MADIVHLDPVKLRRFAETLTSTIATYRRSLDTLDTKLGRLRSTWQDRQFEEFAREVRTTRSIIAEFIEASVQAREHLLQDAEAAEAYQRINLGNR